MSTPTSDTKTLTPQPTLIDHYGNQNSMTAQEKEGQGGDMV